MFCSKKEPVMILLMEEILHQLRLVVYPIFLQGLEHIPGGDRQISEPSTVSIY